METQEAIFNIFYRFGLNDRLVRTLLMTGLEAWELHPFFSYLQD
jgi:hypothetical protein